jgi:hypothetical protein
LEYGIYDWDKPPLSGVGTQDGTVCRSWTRRLEVQEREVKHGFHHDLLVPTGLLCRLDFLLWLYFGFFIFLVE